MSANKGRGRSEKGNPLTKLAKTAKTGTAYLVCIALIAACLVGSLALAAGSGSEDSADGGAESEIYSMTIDQLCDAVEYAVRNGDPLDEREFEFSGSNASEYKKLFDTEDNLLYEIFPDLDEEGDSLTLRTFARLKRSDLEEASAETAEDAEEGYDYEEDLEKDSEEDDGSLSDYNVTGNEEIIFLLINNTDDEVSARIHVMTSDEIYETKEIIVPGNGSDTNITLDTLESIEENDTGVTIDTLESMDTMEYIVIYDVEENVEAASLKAETDSNADNAVVPSISSGSVSVNISIGGTSESASNAVISVESAPNTVKSSAYTDGCTAMSGTLYGSVYVNEQPAAAFVTTLRKLGVEYGIKLLDGEIAYVSTQEELQAALANENITYIQLIDDIEHYCSSDTSYMYIVDRPGITVDLNEHTIQVTDENSNWWAGTMFQVSADNFTLKNGTIDGSRNDVAFYDCYGIWAKTDNINMTLENLTIQDLIMQPVYFRSDGGSVTITNCDISHNANTYNVDGEGACGAGINIQGCDSVKIINSTINYNDTYTNDQINGQANSGDGGGLYLLNVSDVEISNCTFEGNKAKHTGGAMAIWNCGDITIENCTVSGNTGKGYGGGIVVFNEDDCPVGDVKIMNNTVTNNTCEASNYKPSVSGYKPAYGGGIAVVDMATERDDNVECIFSGNTITGNSVPNTSSYYCGGGISLTGMSDGITFRILSGIISNNTGAMGGGLDISQNGDSRVILYNTVITDNEAGQQGGGIWVCPHSKTTVNVTLGGSIYGNTVPDTNRNPSFGGPEGDDIYFNGQTASSEGVFVKVASRALGGTLMDWYADDKDERYVAGVSEPVDVTDPDGGYCNTTREFGLHGNLSDEGIALANAEATLWITDNTANVAGGGIYSNREVDFGEGTDLTVTAEKVWLDHEGNPLTADMVNDFSVDITLVRIDEDGNEVQLETVTLNSENSWTWDFKDLPTRYMDDYGNEHSYKYTAAESNAVSDGSFEVTVKSGEVTEKEDGGYEQEITVTNKQLEPKLTKEEYEDDYGRKDEDIEHDDSNGEFEENIEGDGWGSWDDADNNQEINYRMNLTHVKDIHEMTIHDYLEDGLDFEPDTVNIILYNAPDDSGRVLTRAADDDPDSGEYDYYITQGTCSDTEGFEMEWMPGCTFEVHFAEFLFDPEDEDPEAEPLDDEAHVVLTYNALTHTHAEDYFDDEHTYEDVILNDAYVEGTFGLTMMSFRALPVSTETELFGFGVYKYYTDEAGERQPLSGAKFVLYETGERTDGTTGLRYATFETEKDEDGKEYYLTSGWVDDIEEATKMVSGADGYIRIEGLDDDTYYLTETDAPEGYQKLSGDITVIIDEDDAVTANGQNVSQDNEFPHEISVGNEPAGETSEPEYINISGIKTWDHNNNAAENRPESITIRLFAGTTEISLLKVTEADDWKWEFTHLLKYDENGEEIIYTIAEDQVEDYTTEYDHDKDSGSYTVTNTYTPGKIGLSVEKEWVDSDNSKPVRSEITVELLRNGEETGLTRTLSESNEWFASFTDLDEYDSEGNKYVYTVKELNVPDDYEAEVDHLGETNVFVITNTYIPPETPGSPNSGNSTGSLTVSKTVTNGGSTSRDFDFTLEFTGGEPGSTLTVIKRDKNNVETDRVDITFAENGHASYEFTLRHNESIYIESIPDGIDFTVTEASVSYYSTTVETTSENPGTISGDVKVAFTNRWTGSSSGGSSGGTTYSSAGGGGHSSYGSSETLNTAHESTGGGTDSDNGSVNPGDLPPTGEPNTAANLLAVCTVLLVLLEILFYIRHGIPKHEI